MKSKYYVVLYFEFFEDSIQYRFTRVNDNLQAMKDYVQSWIGKYGYQYGRIKAIEIYRVYADDGGYDLVYDKYYD